MTKEGKYSEKMNFGCTSNDLKLYRTSKKNINRTTAQRGDSDADQ